jgi:hydrogenase/urease accessory protein HupE
VHLTVVRHGHERVWQAVLLPGEVSPPIALGPPTEVSAAGDLESSQDPAASSGPGGRTGQLWRYLWLGLTHIVPFGLDHILFVTALFLLSSRWKPLLFQVTAFTVAHSVTLALATLGLIELSSSIVEPLIALSIVAVALENLWHETLQTWRLLVVFAFGLLHGLGFAGVLSELGLPERGLVLALVSFNVGVELGQLVVVALALGLTIRWRDEPWFRRRVVVPGSLAIAAVALYWTIDRLV